MNDGKTRRTVVILGGGTAGWMAAAALGRFLLGPRWAVTLVESEAIGTIGVGEATIPQLQLFNRSLGIPEADFLRAVEGTYKLGIQFDGWGWRENRYFHPFGFLGLDLEGVLFSHHWLRWREEGGALDYPLFSTETQAAAQNRFGMPPPDPHLPALGYAYHLDAGLYAALLRRYAEDRGVVRIEGRVAAVERDVERGDLRALTLDDGRRVEGDFFIDCSGFHGVLIERALGSAWEDWSHWLPVDAAVTVRSGPLDPLPPYTRSVAYSAGWRWCIPLQNRTGNGLVYVSSLIDHDAAERLLLQEIDGEPLGEPQRIRFRTGLRRRQWLGNCVALGLSAGFIEPLESTAIYLIQVGIAKLLSYFPAADETADMADVYNREMAGVYEDVRDFVLAHWVVNRREEPLWRTVREVEPPASLAERLARFRARGEVLAGWEDLFKEQNWFTILTGQGLWPEHHHPVADRFTFEEIDQRMRALRAAIERRVAALPPHRAYLGRLLGKTA